jgi:hypothetical protein
VNAVNLLPTKHRPRTPTGGQQGSSYIVIGVLGAAVLMVLLYAVTVNGINSKKAAVARTSSETAQAKKRAEELAPYGNFIQVKEQRVSSVKTLATGRIDWERLALGLAHVLPNDVWLTKASASASGDPGAGGSKPAAPPAAAPPPPAPGGNAGGEKGASSTPAPTTSGTPKPVAQPKMILTGCAPNHGRIADTLVRLRHLPAVADVELIVARKPIVAPTAGGGAPSAAAAGGAGSETCGTKNKKNNLTFEASVTFNAQPGSTIQPGEKKDTVPAALGGGE